MSSTLRNRAGSVRCRQSALHLARLCFFHATLQPAASDGCRGSTLPGKTCSISCLMATCSSCSPKRAVWKCSQTRARGGTTPSGSMNFRTLTWGLTAACREIRVIGWTWMSHQVCGFLFEVSAAGLWDRDLQPFPLQFINPVDHALESGQDEQEFPVNVSL